MKYRNRLKSILLIGLLMLGTFELQAGAIKGELKILNWENSEQTAKVPLMKVRYTFSAMMGEPLQKFIFYYESLDDFTHISGIKLRAQVTKAGIPVKAYITFSPLVDPPEQWSWDVWGSPNWNQWMQSDSGVYLSEEETKGYFGGDMGLTNLEIIKIDVSQDTTFDREYDAFRKHMISTITSPKRSYFMDSLSSFPTKANKAKTLLPYSLTGINNAKDNFWSKRQVTHKAGGNISIALSGADDSRQCIPIAKHQRWRYAKYQYVALNYDSCMSGAGLKSAKLLIRIHAYQWVKRGTGYQREKVAEHKHSAFLGANQEVMLIDKFETRKGIEAKPLYDYEFFIDFEERGKKKLKKDVFEKLKNPQMLEREAHPLMDDKIAEEIEALKDQNEDFADGNLSNTFNRENEKAWAEKAKDKQKALVAEAKNKAKQKLAEFKQEVQQKQSKEAKRFSGLNRLYVVLGASRSVVMPFDTPTIRLTSGDPCEKYTNQCRNLSRSGESYWEFDKRRSRCFDKKRKECRSDRYRKRQAEKREQARKAKERRDRINAQFQRYQPNSAVSGIYEVRFDPDKLKIDDAELEKRVLDFSWRMLDGYLLSEICQSCVDSNIIYSDLSQVFTSKQQAQSYLNDMLSKGYKNRGSGKTRELTKLNSSGYNYLKDDKKR